MRLIRLPEVDSTSRYLRRLAESPETAPEPWTVVVADRQTAGYGQHGRSWHSDAGGLYASVFLGADAISPVFTLLAGVAAIDACREVSAAGGLGLKWVNDLVWGGRKLGGILTEVCHRKWLILGVGINLRPVEMPEAAGLDQAAGHPVDRDALLRALVGRLREGLALRQSGGNPAIVEAWSRNSVTIGKDVRVENAGHVVFGKAVGLNDDGHLLLDLPDGKRLTLTSGSIRLSDGSYA